jgi:hypothetical protein
MKTSLRSNVRLSHSGHPPQPGIPMEDRALVIYKVINQSDQT